MNKTYNKPVIKVVTLQQRHLLSASDGMNGEMSGYRKASSGFSQDGGSPTKEQNSNSSWNDDWSK